jgi:FlhB-like protein
MFTLKPITPDIKKINPVNGIKNLVNKKKLVELVKTTLKFVVIGYLSYIALRDAMRDVVLIVRSELFIGLRVIGSIVWDFCIKIGGVFIVIAAADAFYQKKRYIKENMMSKYDVKQEYKQSEGDPHHKAARKQFHQEILNSAAPANIKNADVVVRNPHQIAVALKYDKEGDSEDGKGAPKVIAKGERIWADQILEAAKRYGVPIVRNVPLAQALNKLEIDEEIPEELYEAVAEVLNFVYQLAEEQRKKDGLCAARSLPPPCSSPHLRSHWSSRNRPSVTGRWSSTRMSWTCTAACISCSSQTPMSSSRTCSTCRSASTGDSGTTSTSACRSTPRSDPVSPWRLRPERASRLVTAACLRSACP